MAGHAAVPPQGANPTHRGDASSSHARAGVTATMATASHPPRSGGARTASTTAGQPARPWGPGQAAGAGASSPAATGPAKEALHLRTGAPDGPKPGHARHASARAAATAAAPDKTVPAGSGPAASPSPSPTTAVYGIVTAPLAGQPKSAPLVAVAPTAVPAALGGLPSYPVPLAMPMGLPLSLPMGLPVGLGMPLAPGMPPPPHGATAADQDPDAAATDAHRSASAAAVATTPLSASPSTASPSTAAARSSPAQADVAAGAGASGASPGRLDALAAAMRALQMGSLPYGPAGYVGASVPLPHSVMGYMYPTHPPVPASLPGDLHGHGPPQGHPQGHMQGPSHGQGHDMAVGGAPPPSYMYAPPTPSSIPLDTDSSRRMSNGEVADRDAAGVDGYPTPETPVGQSSAGQHAGDAKQSPSAGLLDKAPSDIVHPANLHAAYTAGLGNSPMAYGQSLYGSTMPYGYPYAHPSMPMGLPMAMPMSMHGVEGYAPSYYSMYMPAQSGAHADSSARNNNGNVNGEGNGNGDGDGDGDDHGDDIGDDHGDDNGDGNGNDNDCNDGADSRRHDSTQSEDDEENRLRQHQAQNDGENPAANNGMLGMPHEATPSQPMMFPHAYYYAAAMAAAAAASAAAASAGVNEGDGRNDDGHVSGAGDASSAMGAVNAAAYWSYMAQAQAQAMAQAAAAAAAVAATTSLSGGGGSRGSAPSGGVAASPSYAAHVPMVSMGETGTTLGPAGQASIPAWYYPTYPGMLIGMRPGYPVSQGPLTMSHAPVSTHGGMRPEQQQQQHVSSLSSLSPPGVPMQSPSSSPSRTASLAPASAHAPTPKSGPSGPSLVEASDRPVSGDKPRSAHRSAARSGSQPSGGAASHPESHRGARHERGAASAASSSPSPASAAAPHGPPGSGVGTSGGSSTARGMQRHHAAQDAAAVTAPQGPAGRAPRPGRHGVGRSGESSGHHSSLGGSSGAATLAELPKCSTNLYVRGLPSTTTDASFAAICAAHGPLVSCKAMLDLQSGACKGFGFAMYASGEAACQALESLQGEGYLVSLARMTASVATVTAVAAAASSTPTAGGATGGLGGSGASSADEPSSAGKSHVAASAGWPPADKSAAAASASTSPSASASPESGHGWSSGPGGPAHSSPQSGHGQGLPMGMHLPMNLSMGMNLGLNMGMNAGMASPPPPSGAVPSEFQHRLTKLGDIRSNNLYLANLPPTLTASDLEALVVPFAPVVSVKMLRDPKTGLGRGVGFIRLQDRADAARVIRVLHGRGLRWAPRGLAPGRPVLVLAADETDVAGPAAAAHAALSARRSTTDYGQPWEEQIAVIQVRFADSPAQKELKRQMQHPSGGYHVGHRSGVGGARHGHPTNAHLAIAHLHAQPYAQQHQQPPSLSTASTPAALLPTSNCFTNRGEVTATPSGALSSASPVRGGDPSATGTPSNLAYPPPDERQAATTSSLPHSGTTTTL
ncbi:hypothetical protein CXG81DRAFT_18774 [Caulochytrium protostelioides]|uniref:RRM domain-containing protein n=1 Tax=Caulochytrium protostelioides TaxID=1555241 RepID=A0A4P9X818_9FUNG|nr:hypothetical protein CXG81DRAFT_18774 [Caulochytrium protostelioides]|eukprot:RKP01403.1 hypothetical protein CXG81DRAFT_18774 [Caulochytrium protostelioides]